MDALERAQEVTHIGPHSFDGVAVHLTDAVAIIISRPSVDAMSDRRVLTNDVIVALILISRPTVPIIGGRSLA
jgi:hypothetical protein